MVLSAACYNVKNPIGTDKVSKIKHVAGKIIGQHTFL